MTRLESDIEWAATGSTDIATVPNRKVGLIRHINAYATEIGLTRQIKHLSDLSDGEGLKVIAFYNSRSTFNRGK